MMNERLPVKVESVKQIVINWKLKDTWNNKEYLYTRRFKSAHQAAKFYAEYSNNEFHTRLGWDIDWENRQERLRRRLVPVFKRMLK
jgi:hypothetical protein